MLFRLTSRPNQSPCFQNTLQTSLHSTNELIQTRPQMTQPLCASHISSESALSIGSYLTGAVRLIAEGENCNEDNLNAIKGEKDQQENHMPDIYNSLTKILTTCDHQANEELIMATPVLRIDKVGK